MIQDHGITMKGMTLFLKLGKVQDAADQGLTYDLKRGAASQVQGDGERNKLQTWITPQGEKVVDLLMAEPFEKEDIPLAEDETWWLEVKEEHIPGPWQKPITINGESHACLDPAAVEDLGILCHYTVAVDSSQQDDD